MIDKKHFKDYLEFPNSKRQHYLKERGKYMKEQFPSTRGLILRFLGEMAEVEDKYSRGELLLLLADLTDFYYSCNNYPPIERAKGVLLWVIHKQLQLPFSVWVKDNLNCSVTTAYRCLKQAESYYKLTHSDWEQRTRYRHNNTKTFAASSLRQFLNRY